jgi:hypothetical protein
VGSSLSSHHSDWFCLPHLCTKCCGPDRKIKTKIAKLLSANGLAHFDLACPLQIIEPQALRAKFLKNKAQLSSASFFQTCTRNFRLSSSGLCVSVTFNLGE